MPRPWKNKGKEKAPSEELVVVSQSATTSCEAEQKPGRRERIFNLFNTRPNSPTPATPLLVPRQQYGASASISTDAGELTIEQNRLECATSARATGAPPPPKDTTSATSTNTNQLAPAAHARGQQPHASGLWSKAYDQLPEENKKDLANVDRLQYLEKLLDVVNEVKERKIASQWKLQWGNTEINLREKAETIVGCITKFKEIGDLAVQYDPVHAALPWAGVRLLLMVCTPISEPTA